MLFNVDTSSVIAVKQNSEYIVGFEVLTAVSMKMTVFWVSLGFLDPKGFESPNVAMSSLPIEVY
jgi:hypothetical protein